MRRNKLTVIAVLTLFLLCINGQYHDWYWNMNDWSHMDPYDMGNMQPHDKIHHQLQDPMHGNNRNYYDDEQIDPYLQVTIDIFYFICFVVLVAINICLCVKCLKKHKQRKNIQEQMRLRRISFATLHGFDVQTLNDPRYSNTIHL